MQRLRNTTSGRGIRTADRAELRDTGRNPNVRSWGADAVGMSTACRTHGARHMGMEVCGISCITNMAAGVSDAKLNHAEVQETADRVAKDFEKLVTDVIVAI